MSKIFQWYGADFGSKADIISLLQKYLTGSAREIRLASISGDPDKIELHIQRVRLEPEPVMSALCPKQ